MSQAGYTRGYACIGKWSDRDSGEAMLVLGLPAPLRDGEEFDIHDHKWTWTAWTHFRSEADAHRFVKGWNALIAADPTGSSDER